MCTILFSRFCLVEILGSSKTNHFSFFELESSKFLALNDRKYLSISQPPEKCFSHQQTENYFPCRSLLCAIHSSFHPEPFEANTMEDSLSGPGSMCLRESEGEVKKDDNAGRKLRLLSLLRVTFELLDEFRFLMDYLVCLKCFQTDPVPQIIPSSTMKVIAVVELSRDCYVFVVVDCL